MTRMKTGANRSSWCFVWAWALLIITLGCGPTDAERRVVTRWLTCDECTDGERDSVQAASDAVVPLLEAALDTVPTALEDARERDLLETWGTIPQPSLSESDFVAFFLRNARATTQRRAAVALGDRGEISILLAARQSHQLGFIQYEEDVLSELEYAIASADSTAFTGLGPPASLEVQPQTMSIYRGEIDYAIAVVRDANGTELPNQIVVWTTADANIADRTEEPPRRVLISATGNGTTQVTASIALTTLSDATTVTVEDPPTLTLTKVAGEPQSGKVNEGLPDDLVVRVDDGGVPQGSVTVTWEVVSGTASFVRSGSSSETTDTDGVTGEASVRVMIGSQARPVLIMVTITGIQTSFRFQITT
jgi:hypothetical protein